MNYRFADEEARRLWCAPWWRWRVRAAMARRCRQARLSGGGSALNSDGSNLKASAPLAISPRVRGDQHQHDADAGRARGRGPVRIRRRAAHRFQVGRFRLLRQHPRQRHGRHRCVGRDALDRRPGADGEQARGVARSRRARRCLWSLVERDGVHDCRRGSPRRRPPTAAPRPRPARVPPDPPPGVRLPLPDMRGVARAVRRCDSQSCPRGLKYVNNPWQDRVIDAFRQIDSRWGYNGKPTKTAADNNGVPVTAAGDEAAYHYSGGSRPGLARCAPRRHAGRPLRQPDADLARVHG